MLVKASGRTTSTCFQKLAESIQGYLRDQMPMKRETHRDRLIHRQLTGRAARTHTASGPLSLAHGRLSRSHARHAEG